MNVQQAPSAPQEAQRSPTEEKIAAHNVSSHDAKRQCFPEMPCDRLQKFTLSNPFTFTD
jgi:hypothetical protein